MSYINSLVWDSNTLVSGNFPNALHRKERAENCYVVISKGKKSLAPKDAKTLLSMKAIGVLANCESGCLKGCSKLWRPKNLWF